MSLLTSTTLRLLFNMNLLSNLFRALDFSSLETLPQVLELTNKLRTKSNIGITSRSYVYNPKALYFLLVLACVICLSNTMTKTSLWESIFRVHKKKLGGGCHLMWNLVLMHSSIVKTQGDIVRWIDRSLRLIDEAYSRWQQQQKEQQWHYRGIL